MARIRRAPGKRRTAIADYLIRRVDEEKARNPSKSYAQIGRELGIQQKDPARLIRKLRSGESSGRLIVPELAGLRPVKPRRGVIVKPPIMRGRFVVAYQWWYTAQPGSKYWARTNILIDRTSPLDIFRLAHDPRIIAAVELDLRRKAAKRRRESDGSVPIPDRGSYAYRIDGVYAEHSQHAAPVIIRGSRVA